MTCKFEKDYKNLAKMVLRRNQIRLDGAVTTIEKETSGFFYWIMSQMLWTIEGSRPPKKHNDIKLVATYIESIGKVVVQHGRVSTYYSEKGISREEFFKIMQNTAKLLDSIDGYSATYLHEEGTNVAIFNVHLINDN